MFEFILHILFPMGCLDIWRVTDYISSRVGLIFCSVAFVSVHAKLLFLWQTELTFRADVLSAYFRLTVSLWGVFRVQLINR